MSVRWELVVWALTAARGRRGRWRRGGDGGDGGDGPRIMFLCQQLQEDEAHLHVKTSNSFVKCYQGSRSRFSRADREMFLLTDDSFNVTTDLLSQQPQTKAALFKSFHYSPAAVIINNCRWCATIGCLNNVDILVDIRTRTVVDYWSSTCSPDRISMTPPPAEAPDGVESEAESVQSSLTDWRCHETRVHCS